MVILGGKKPCVVELTSNIAVGVASEVAPTITFPPTVALSNVPTLVKLDPVTVEFNEEPVNVPASTEGAGNPVNLDPSPTNAVAETVPVADMAPEAIVPVKVGEASGAFEFNAV